MSTAVHRGFRRQPALDGVRGVAVALVLLFHHGWLSGGYVGVSVFFTLSGYLITSLALAEHDRTGRLDVGAFYGRRVRRLLPAGLACLLGVVVLAAIGLLSDVDRLRRDLWAALTQVYNWVALTNDQTYADLVAGEHVTQSPLDHFWSLAIEEQFYWLWPIALVVILRRPSRGRILLIGGLTAVFAVAAPLIAMSWGPDAAYWATPARLAEILAGALLAAVLHARRGRRLPRSTALLAPAGLAIIVWAAVAWPSGSGPAYTGWMPAFALASVALLLGLQVPSRLRRALCAPPLIVLGAISYGVYVFHWPVFVVLTEERTHLPSAPLFALRMLVTLALALLSFRHLEAPIRRASPRRLVAPTGAFAASAVVALAVVVVPSEATPYWAPDDATAASLAPVSSGATLPPLASGTTEPATSIPAAGVLAEVGTAPTDATPSTTTIAAPPSEGPAPTPPPTSAAPVVPALPPLPPRPVRVVVVGDSTAIATGQGLIDWAGANPGFAAVEFRAAPGCGIIADGVRPNDAGGFDETCRDVRARATAELPALQPDVVVGMVTFMDLEERIWDDAEGPLGFSDPRFYERLVAAYDAAGATYLAAGATDVLWIVPPIPVYPVALGDEYKLDPARYDRYAQALRDAAAARPDHVAVVDLRAWLATQPAMPERPDGLHWSNAAAREIADRFLAPVVLTAALSG